VPAKTRAVILTITSFYNISVEFLFIAVVQKAKVQKTKVPNGSEGIQLIVSRHYRSGLLFYGDSLQIPLKYYG
jgi:hypothetical protein